MGDAAQASRRCFSEQILLTNVAAWLRLPALLPATTAPQRHFGRIQVPFPGVCRGVAGILARREAGRRLGEGHRGMLSALAGCHRPDVRFDLTGVTFIDTVSEAYLAAMLRQGAKFVTAYCLTKAVVAEITQAPLSDGGRARQTRHLLRAVEP